VPLSNTVPATNTVVVVGTDGATYTYTGVVGAPAIGTLTKAGLNIGTAGPTGITFGIMIPDVDGQVCATPALEAWSVGTPLDVRSLPSICLPGDLSLTDASLSGAHQNVLVVTDSGAGSTGADVKNVLAGTQITPTTLNLNPSQSPAEQADAIAQASIVKPAIPASPAIPATATSPAKPARRAVPAITSNLVVIALGSDNPAAAAMLTAQLPPTQQVLWVIPPLPSGSAGPPAGTPSMAAQYAIFSAAHPNVRVDWLSASFASLTTGTVTAPNSTWSSVGAQVVASNVAGYAAAAYGLPTASAAVSKVLAYAEAQLGKPYQWAGAGPAAFDCSGLTMAAFAQVGISLAHNANTQFMATKSESVSEADLQPGDLVFFGGADGTTAAPGHVGIYLGNAQYIAAPDTGGVVSISTLAPGDGFVGASRPLASISLAGDTMISSGVGLSSLAGMVDSASVGPDQAIARAMVDAIWNDSQWAFLDALWVRESGWNPFAMNPTSGAYGIPQSLPADKMASVAPDWATNATTQITWGVEYIQATYGSPQAAWAHEVAFNWY
jgi:cell wall-associated NlpC family hydrolase